MLRGLPNDPLFPSQWHLQNTGQGGGSPGVDVNVSPWWDFTGNSRLGAGINIGIVDSGHETNHPDLAANYRPELSYDFLANDTDPSPQGGSGHGTAVAGLAAARGGNGLGVTGVAPLAGIAGIRLVSPTFQTDVMEAAALTHQNNDQQALGTIHIYNNSWGPQDDGRTLAGPGPLTRAALASGAASGRLGLGSIFVFATGNGKVALDNANYDGYANSRFVIAIGATTNQALPTTYSEPGACVFVCAPSDGGPGAGSRIVTTDRTGALGYNTALVNGDYATTFAGTSAAAPQVAGVIALMLEANPNLSWRDVKHILALTAVKNAPLNSGWTTNAAGFHHHDSFGFGLVDANAAATTAVGWVPVASETVVSSGPIPVGLPIADGSGMSLTIPVYGATVSSGFVCTAATRVETAVVTLNALHAYRGDLEVTLTSPAGTESLLGTIRNDSGDNYTGWRFSTVKSWGEFAAGTWTLTVRDGISNDSGTWTDWSLDLYGTGVIPLPQITGFQHGPAGQLEFRHPSISGTAYQVFHSESLGPRSWEAVGPPMVATATETIWNFTASPNRPKDFFVVAPVH